MQTITRYPWEAWFRQRRFTAVRGRDFHPDVKMKSFLNMVRQRAIGRFHVKMRVSGDSVDVVLTPRTRQLADLFSEN